MGVGDKIRTLGGNNETKRGLLDVWVVHGAALVDGELLQVVSVNGGGAAHHLLQLTRSEQRQHSHWDHAPQAPVNSTTDHT